jgi:hypothetical protein
MRTSLYYLQSISGGPHLYVHVLLAVYIQVVPMYTSSYYLQGTSGGPHEYVRVLLATYVQVVPICMSGQKV